jgi:two-component system phosphate regulon response regulator PhoB/two-component system alkaline phosphatase synthesis response regulator PhoP
MAGNKKILIVEDDEFLRSLAAKRLEKDGFGVKDAVDGEAALKAIEGDKFDLILLDLLLPGTDGFTVLEKGRAMPNGKDVPIVVFSNLGERADIEKAKKLGATDFMVKANFTLDDIVSKIHTLLG